MGKIYNKSVFKPKHAQANLTTPDPNQSKTMGSTLGNIIWIMLQSQGPFKGKKFKFYHTDPKTGERGVKELGG